MDEQRQKLISLMEELKTPLTSEEAENMVKHFNDQEIANLVEVYSELVEYENSLEDFVRESNPEEYDRLVTEREEKIKKIDSDYEYKLEKSQEQEDINLDSLDIKEERIIDSVVHPDEELAQLVEDIERDIEAALDTSITKRNNLN